MSSDDRIKNIVEAALLAAGGPLNIERLLSLFPDGEQPERPAIREALQDLTSDYSDRGIEVKEVANGWRIQVSSEMAPWVSRLWEERPARYSRALMETLALVAYRQPITRGEIEDVRGVTVSTNIVKTLLEREWVRVVGHRDVPGKPALYATTREFLDYFGLKSLEDLPTLGEIKDLESLNEELPFAETPGNEAADSESPERADDEDTGDARRSPDEEPSVGDDSPEMQRETDAEATSAGDGAADPLQEDEAAETRIPVTHVTH